MKRRHIQLLLPDVSQGWQQEQGRFLWVPPLEWGGTLNPFQCSHNYSRQGLGLLHSADLRLPPSGHGLNLPEITIKEAEAGGRCRCLTALPKADNWSEPGGRRGFVCVHRKLSLVFPQRPHLEACPSSQFSL